MFLDHERGEVEPWRCSGLRSGGVPSMSAAVTSVNASGGPSGDHWTCHSVADRTSWGSKLQPPQSQPEDTDASSMAPSDEDMEDVFPDEYVDLGKRRLLTRHLEHISGLPFVCNNCGVSFFSLRSIEDEDECYCSGECKWSVIMYREMDRRMYALRQSESYESSYDQESEYYESYQCLDDVISCR